MPAYAICNADTGDIDPLAAAARFHAEFLPQIEDQIARGAACITVCFGYGDDREHEWRRSAIAALARKHAPCRVNAVAPADTGADSDALRDAIEFLGRNQAITGQLLIVA